MPFNLNKTDQAASKFNLSKDVGSPVAEENIKRPNKTLWTFITLLVAGGLVVYLLCGNPATENTATVAAVSQAPPVASGGVPVVTGSGATEGAATTAKVTNGTKPVYENVAAETIVNALQNSVPGSFDPGSSSLHPAAAVVNNLVDVLSRNPAKRIVIKGYASSEGDLAVNRQLSGERARSFKEYLVGKGIAAGRITTEAKGIEDPLAANDTEEGRKKNRRVQLTITD